MVSVIIKRDLLGNSMGFSCDGHAGYAEKGVDIICAGISALTMTTVLALDQLTKLQLKIKQDPAQGLLECDWDSIPTEVQQANLIVQVMAIGLQDMAAQYPEYLKVSEVEV
ncbi:MAG TPA: hypothetical protein DDW65_05560 [Firmicutes bacterium]|jgi:uncharacterized protein|nr:hypothetical protein [Bacillota bacterium]